MKANAGSTTLSDGGNVEMAWQETFWAHGFGKVTDKYGVPWMINVVKAAALIFGRWAVCLRLSSNSLNSSNSRNRDLTQMSY